MSVFVQQDLEGDRVEEGVRKAANPSPLEGAELVLYSAEAEWAEQEPTHEILRDLDLASWSLWARFEEDGVEIPLVGEASWHIWYSLSADTWNPDPAEPVSDAFKRSIAQMVDEDVGEGWGDIQQDVWESLTDLEKYVHHIVRMGYLEADGAEPAMVVDWCVQNAPEVGP